MDIKLIVLGGFLAIFIGILICFSKHQEEKIKVLFGGMFIIMLGIGIISMAFTQTYVEAKINDTKREILQTIYEQKYIVDEIDYSIMEIDSITGKRTYRQCSVDTCFVPYKYSVNFN